MTAAGRLNIDPVIVSIICDAVELEMEKLKRTVKTEGLVDWQLGGGGTAWGENRWAIADEVQTVGHIEVGEEGEHSHTVYRC